MLVDTGFSEEWKIGVDEQNVCSFAKDLNSGKEIHLNDFIFFFSEDKKRLSGEVVKFLPGKKYFIVIDVPKKRNYDEYPIYEKYTISPDVIRENSYD